MPSPDSVLHRPFGWEEPLDQRARGADEGESGEERDLAPELRRLRSDQECGKHADGNGIARRRAARPSGIVLGSVIMKNRKTRISGENTSTRQK